MVKIKRLQGSKRIFPGKTCQRSWYAPFHYWQVRKRRSKAVVKKLANILDTTVGYLLGKSEDRDLLKDPAMLKRLNEIEKMDKDKTHILHVLDGFIKSVKLKNIAAL